MLGWILAFMILAILSALLGFGGLAGAFTGIAKILFFLFVVAFVISFFVNLGRGQSSKLL
ncbi:MAG TPA: DUF1328 domain-containing protein [Myxococcales bacterium]|nr:DUF1328 domain-containing protein [Deltaproteobacteria bacterium]HAA53608.1 DUF1328 domain-containing protein [Myxococcales bacterium]|tara:strand:+ start:9112 stop:9291 length:180 start_codon:yes stop_codon:yes gene_type:complete